MRAFLLRIRAKVVSDDGRHARTGREMRFAAPVFIDCSGRALLGQYAHAQTLHGQVSQAEYGENLAPKQGEETHHGHTVFFRTTWQIHPLTLLKYHGRPKSPKTAQILEDRSSSLASRSALAHLSRG
tara:strand:+ start:949 stop:1329 length:381 start_codon:yes stop_codon:yes gene_type:complete